MNAPAKIEQKPQLVVGNSVTAIVPTSVEEAFRLATIFHKSSMVPNSLKSPEQVMVAIMAGAELGMVPFQAVRHIAVVNGRPTLWGDGLVAVARSQGVQVNERIEGDGDKMRAICTVTRPDTGEVIERIFDVADAKKAGLWGKSGPWQQYPKRMLAMRARAFALRDGAADILNGFQVAEEVEDYGARDVTPNRTETAAQALHLETAKDAEIEIIDDDFEAGAENAASDAETVAEQGEDTGAEEVDTETRNLFDGDDFPGDRA